MDPSSLGVAIDLEQHESVGVLGVDGDVEAQAAGLVVQRSVGVLPERIEELLAVLRLHDEFQVEDDGLRRQWIAGAHRNLA